MAIKLTGLNSGMDTDSIVKELMSAHSLKLTKIQNKKTTNTWTQDKWKELNKKIYGLYTGNLSKARLVSNYKTKKASSSNEDSISVVAKSTSTTGAHKVQVNELASSQYVTGEKLQEETTSKTTLEELGFTGNGTITIKSKESTQGTVLDVSATTTIDDFLAKCKEEGINASYDATQKRIFLSSTETGANQAFSLSAEGEGAEALNALGLTTIDEDGSLGNGADMSFVKAQDAEIILNGARIECATNEPEINGLKLSLKQKTDAEITIAVSNDTSAVYDMVSSFISGYNEILSAMNEAYYADPATGYSPLTDEEKESMTDDQIEKWETKIKDSLLRRDSTLNSLISSFKSVMSSTVEVNGKKYSLSSLGICTSSDYTEKGLLHIKGDSQDSTYSDQTNVLMNMLEEDPDTVAQVIQGIASKLYETMGNKMGTTSLSSALTFYNDKQLTKNDKQYDEEISKMKDKLQTLEDRYYSQFTAMETAMAKLNAQQSSLASILA